MAEFKTFRATYRKSLFLNITAISYKAKPRKRITAIWEGFGGLSHFNITLMVYSISYMWLQ